MVSGGQRNVAGQPMTGRGDGDDDVLVFSKGEGRVGEDVGLGGGCRQVEQPEKTANRWCWCRVG